jgi:hypothetical protein
VRQIGVLGVPAALFYPPEEPEDIAAGILRGFAPITRDLSRRRRLEELPASSQ